MDEQDAGFSNFPEGIKWIWTAEEKVNQYVGALREFTLESVCESAKIHIFADALYKLYINGEFVNAGPTPFRKPVMHVDTYDVASYLKPGKNTVFIVSHFFGINIKMINAQKAGILASMEFGNEHIYTGDGGWKIWELDCWTAETPRINWARAFVEEIDFSREGAQVLAAYACSDYGVADKKELPAQADLVEYPVENAEFCSRIAPNLRWNFESELRLDEIYMLNPQVQNLNDISDRYYTDHKTPLYDAAKYNSTDDQGYTVLNRVKGDRGYGVVYDLQRVVAGDVKLEVIADSDCTVDVCMAEGKLRGIPYFSPGGSKYYYRMKCRKGANLFRAFKFYGWRYIYVVVKDVEGSIRMKPVSCHCRADLDYVDTFKCGDLELETIYDISKRSVKLNTQACTYDCNSREIGVYWADSMWVSEMLGQMSGSYQHMKQLCYAMSDEYKALGVLHSSAFGMGNPLYDFCLIAVHMLHRYYCNTGDIDAVKDNIATCKSIIDDFRKSKDQTGMLTLAGIPYEHEGGFLFLDHAGTTWHPMQTTSIVRKDYSAGLNLYYLMALKSFASLKNALGERCESTEKEIDELFALLSEKFYDKSKGLIADAVTANGTCEGHSQIVNALAIVLGITTGDDALDVMAMISDPQRYKWIAQGTPYTWWWLAEAAKLSGTVETCLLSIRKYWQGMLERGATTTWEAFGGENHDSLNHAWSAVLPQLITRGVVGVSPLEPGFSRTAIKPSFESLESFSHTFVLPQGNGHVSWIRKEAKTYHFEISLPKSVEAVLSLPDRDDVTFNGEFSCDVTLL